MKGRNPLTGRHAAGSPIARSGIQPPKRTGPAGLRSPGARRYKNNVPITSATLMQTPSRSSSANDYTRQGQQFISQSPEPFRNPQPSANPMPMPTKDSSVVQSGAGGGFYRPYKGNRISEQQVTSMPSRANQMKATGHDPGYQYRGLYSVNSGFPLSARRGMKADNSPSNQPPSATMKSPFKTNRDIFNDQTLSYLKKL